MRNKIWIGCLMLILTAGVIGCAGTPSKKTSQSVSPSVALPGPPVNEEHPSLDQLLDKVCEDIAQRLKTDSFLKNRPFIIVKAHRGSASEQIDSLTEYIRERLTSYLLGHKEIQLILRHPVSPIDRPYHLDELKCGGFVDYSLLLTIDVQASDFIRGNLAELNFRAIDIQNGTYVRGFSIYNKFKLTSYQTKELAKVHPDENLRGLKYLPFTSDQNDEMADYLARNLSCIFKESHTDSDNEINVYLEGTKEKRIRNTVEMIKKKLNYFKKIQLANKKENADWIIAANRLETGTNTGLYQFWVETYENEGGKFVKGLATYAYYKACNISFQIVPAEATLLINGDPIILNNHGFVKIRDLGSHECSYIVRAEDYKSEVGTFLPCEKETIILELKTGDSFYSIRDKWYKTVHSAMKNKDFSIQLWTNKTDYRLGEAIQFNFQSEKNCYLNLVDINSKGEISLIFPNRFHSSNYIQGGKTYTIPGSDYDFAFKIVPPYGIERIYAIASTHPIHIFKQNFQQEIFVSMNRGKTRDIDVYAIGEKLEQTNLASAAECIICIER